MPSKKLHKTCLLLVAFCLSQTLFAQQQIITTDVSNFWKAYDKIVSTTDTAKQYSILRNEYLLKGTDGLSGLVKARNYTEKEFIDAINNYPKFWNSIRQNTLNTASAVAEINSNINQLKALYPSLKPVPIYFAVGAFRTNGTVYGKSVLIGTELALADSTTIVDELPEWRQPFYKEYEPKKNIALLCTHEYVHTQQNDFVENLLSMCLYEGVAEFVSCKATGKKSNTPAIEFGKANEQRVVAKFVVDMFTMSNNYNWIWGANKNELKVRDLGYYIGYEICERYYNQASDKAGAVKELIEIDYTNEAQVERIVNASKLFPKPLNELYAEYEQRRPTAVATLPFIEGSNLVKPGLTKITVKFSEPLNGYNSGIDFGPLGEKAMPAIGTNRTWATDKASWVFEADLKPSMHYQVLIPNTFRKEDGTRLKPYLIDITTAAE